MAEKIELKPCPFCGSKAEMVEQRLPNTATRYGVCCGECDNGTWKWYESESEAAAAWNRRAKL